MSRLNILDLQNAGTKGIHRERLSLFSTTLVLFVVALVLIIQANAMGGTILFDESWNGYANNTNNPFLADPDTADETWFGGRFEFFDTNPLSGDLNVRYTGINIDGNYMRVEDDGGVLFNVSTLGYENVTLSFDWRTHLTESSDRLKVGYSTNEGDGVLLVFDKDGTGLRERDFLNEDFGGVHADAVQWWDDNFTTLLFGEHESSWLSPTFALPDDTASVWVAFFMDDGMGDRGKFDNVVVMGDLIPEPSTAVMALLGAVMLGCFRRRRCV